MGLVHNGHRLLFSPFQARGGGLVSIYGAGRAPRNWDLPGSMRGLRYLTSSRSARPHGGLAGTSWMLPQVAGAIVSRNLATVSITATGNVAQGRPVAGSASLSISAAGDVYGVGAVAGSASISISAAGDVYGVAAVAGSASLSITATGTVNAIAAVAGSATMTIAASATMGCLATVAGAAQFSGAAEGEALTADAVATAVWSTAIEAGYTADQILRLLAAHAAGAATGLEGANPQFVGLDGTTVRIDGTYAAGTRTIDALDGS